MMFDSMSEQNIFLPYTDFRFCIPNNVTLRAHSLGIKQKGPEGENVNACSAEDTRVSPKFSGLTNFVK